ncbi:TELO2-interacting protein 1 homolog [Daktulosphaira vitifoliae]|uniref:TELO2-interacting protein 1 homolog n=1 Tax=Daktulosphaira vitifoliae TaxID=58002 RepID=UPI0021AAD481|nr:TELO2-interacting protein 1 homolog [Daktulosphaira vitifoliae]XP_050532255.1 TELO2-interacting protein 1 homolog [Daktulosphaira vitifoliae]XP_050532256.1 TELO2-interacting protein 1 homolog [Daktulosphaira vitifoliae]XP_050532257.1 TELO2-interacting protein 1 homolog [Daktulosphaira vitifoliae]
MTLIKDDFKKAFATLKPVCDAFITEPNSENSKRFIDALELLPINSLDPLHRYILIPIEVHLKNNTNSNFTLNVLDVLSIFLQKISINVWPTFSTIYSLLVSKLFNKSYPDKESDASEDLKLKVLISINLLVEKSDKAIIIYLYNDADCKNVGYFIYICTKIIRNEKMNILRFEALKSIQILTSVWKKINDYNISNKIVQNLIKFIPGILTICTFVAKAPDTQHHSLTVAALNLWSSITSLIICDENFIVESNQYYKNPNKNKNFYEELKIISDWIKENNQNFKLVASQLIKTREHHHWRVRLQLAISCDILLNKCTSSLESLVTELVETLLILCDDKQPQVDKLANETVSKLMKSFDGNNKKTLIELLEESFYALLTRIPRSIRMSNISKQMTELSLLLGYLKLFGYSHLPRILNSHAHLDRMITVLMEIIELEHTNIILLEDNSIRDLKNVNIMSKESSLNDPWKQLVHFNDTSALFKVESICKLIGMYGDLNYIVRYLMDLFETKIFCRREITFLLNLILLEGNDNNHYNLVSDVIQLYLEPETWYLSTVVNDKLSQNISDTQKNVIQICLMTEGLGQLICSLDVDKQHACLIHCLYPILERIGSELNPISLAGEKAIVLLSKSGGYKDPVDIIIQNSDYLSHHFSSKLWTLCDHPEVLNALSVVMNIGVNENLLRSFHAIVTDVLVQSCDIYREDYFNSFLKVFYIFVVCVRNWSQNINKKPQLNPDKVLQTSDCFIENILQYHRMMTMDFSSDNETWKNDIPSTNNEENKEPLPSYVQMVISIMKRVLNFLPLQHHFVPLQILNEGLYVLSNYENQLLPIIHKIWSPLCTKFNEKSNDLVFREAFNLLNTMGILSKDFIRSRLLKQVIPSIIDRLKSSSKESRNIHQDSFYFTNHKYKLQSTILKNIGDLVLNLNFLEKDLYEVLNSVAYYLDKNQPLILQEFSQEFYLKLYKKHPDYTWIFLQSLSIDEYEYKSKNEKLPSIKVYSLCDLKKKNILKNVNKLLQKMD